jgi:hypothetical protein
MTVHDVEGVAGGSAVSAADGAEDADPGEGAGVAGEGETGIVQPVPSHAAAMIART